VEGIIINFRDIHERKLAEEKLWTEKEKLDKIAASVPGVICSFHQSPAGQTSMPYASAAVKEVYGLEPAEIAHDMSPIFSRILPDDMVHVMATIARSAHTLEIWKDEFRYQHPTKGVIWIDGYSAPVREADGGITWHGFIADVTERKLTEQKLCESEQRYTILFQKSNIPAVLIKLPEVVIVDANEASEKLTGFKREELLGKNSAELGLISHTLRTESISRFEKESSLTENEMHIVTKSGEERIILVNTNPLEIQGRPYAITSMQDITDRKRAEKNLRDSEKKYRDLINGMNDVICVVDYDTSILDVNTTATTVLGYSREELLSMKIPDIDVNLTPARIERFAKIMPADQAQVFETMHRTKDGRIIPVEVSSSLVSYGGRVVIMSIARDIRERKQTEAQRSRLAERLNLATRAAQIGIWDWDMLKNELVWDEQMHMLYGVSPADFSGVYEAWLNGVHPDDRDSTADILARALRNECEYDTEFRVVWPDGTGHWLHANGQVFRDENGKPVRMVGMNYDITERKQAERERARLEEQLQRSQKLETIGTLAGGIAHDFNNILTPIMGYTDMAIEHVAPADPLAEDLKMIFNAAKRAKELVEQILIFSRQLDIEQKPLSLHLIVKETVKLLRPTIPSTINIVQNVDASCPPVLADPTQMHQVVMNLCVNAFHAMEENGGTLTIDLQPVNVDRAPADLYPHLKEAEYVRLSISDTGKGMDPSTTNRIFEPFFTTKAPGKGTGMGLSVVHGIVRSHNGDLVVFSEPGKGSIFHVYLPVTLIEPQGGDKDPVTMMGGQEYILVVDDEVAIARMMNKMLEQLGYRADACHSSLEALDLFHYQPGKYDLVISDLTMPGMTGLALAKQLHLLKKELPIILMTGYGKNVSTETLIECGINKVIDKPILRKELAAAVREALAE
jgi:PAS domain S-box-containing protein